MRAIVSRKGKKAIQSGDGVIQKQIKIRIIVQKKQAAVTLYSPCMGKANHNRQRSGVNNFQTRVQDGQFFLGQHQPQQPEHQRYPNHNVMIAVKYLIRGASILLFLIRRFTDVAATAAATDHQSSSSSSSTSSSSPSPSSNNDPMACQAAGVAPSSPLLKKNTALVFVKPHANTPQVHDLVVDQLNQAGIEILSQVDIRGDEIEKRELIDNHYYSIASKATLLKPHQINVPPSKFKETFGEDWDVVLREDRACNAFDACRRFDCTPSELDDLWTEASSIKGNMVKFGGGFYCAKLSYPTHPTSSDTKGGSEAEVSSSLPQKPPKLPKQELYVFNGFFMAMRSKFIGPDKEIRCYVVQWDPSALSWRRFRGQVLGPTNPIDAPSGSIRRMIYDRWNELGLQDVPTNADNGVHASASPFEGLAERMNFLSLRLDDDDFAAYLLDSGLSESTIMSWTKDPQIIVRRKTPSVDCSDGDDDSHNSLTCDDESTATAIYGSVFDELEDLDVTECARRMIELYRYNANTCTDR